MTIALIHLALVKSATYNLLMLQNLLSKESLILAITAAAISFPLTGFIAGIIMCSGCNGFFGNTIGRAFIGGIMAVLNTLFFGRPPRNEGGVGEPHNLIPYTLLVWFLVFLVLLYARSKIKQ